VDGQESKYRDYSFGKTRFFFFVVILILLLIGMQGTSLADSRDASTKLNEDRNSFNPEPKWFEVGRHVNGDTYFIDLISLKKNGDDIYSWELTNYSVPSKVGSRSALLYFESKCNTPKKRRILSATFYKGLMGAGEINSLVQEQGWEYPVPGSINDMVMAFICSK